MDKIEKIKYLSGLLESLGGKVEGRKRFQKIVYILQKLGFFPVNYRFKWNYYGVYSEYLMDDLLFAKFLSIIKENKIEKNDIVKYEISLNNSDFIEKLEIPSEIKNVLFSEDIETRFLEVLSSIFYFEEECKGQRECLFEKLKMFKPHLIRYFDDAYDMYLNLKTYQAKQAC